MFKLKAVNSAWALFNVTSAAAAIAAEFTTISMKMKMNGKKVRRVVKTVAR